MGAVATYLRHLERRLQSVCDGANREAFTIPVQRADDDNEKEELRTTDDTDSEECCNDGESTDCGTAKVIRKTAVDA